jgi:predicted nucleic acid-binding protein
VEQVSLLPRLFGEVLIPPAVERELRRFHADLPDFLRVPASTEHQRLSRLLQDVDLGEAEAICLACERKDDRLLIDDSVGCADTLRAAGEAQGC